MNENIDKDWTLHLLKIVSKNGNINELLYDKYDIAFLMRQMRLYVQTGVLTRVEGRYIITEEGVKLQTSIAKELGYRGIYKNVMHDFRYMQIQLPCILDNMDIDDVYIPRKRAKKDFKS